MARQVRSEATRRKLLDAAIEVFAEVGYGAAGRVAIIERAGVTKGALYHHFESMEALASAIIAEGGAALLAAFTSRCPLSAPALEGMIHGMFAAAELLASDRGARVATRLAVALGGFNDAAAAVRAGWLHAVADQVRRGITEGDLRAELDPEAAAELMVGAMLGVRLLAESGERGEPIPVRAGALTRIWTLLLPALATDAALPYFAEVLARQGQRAC